MTLLRQPKIQLVLGALLLLGWGAPAAPAAAQQLFTESETKAMVEGLQNGTLRPSVASEQCSRELQDDSAREDTRDIMTTYLQVPPESALSAFCDALVLAVKNGELTLEGLLKIARQEEDATAFLEFGRILRAVYFAHHRSTTASLDGASTQ